MTCPNCGRRAGAARIRCPACKTKLVQWYLLVALLILAACYGGFVLLEKFI